MSQPRFRLSALLSGVVVALQACGSPAAPPTPSTPDETAPTTAPDPEPPPTGPFLWEVSGPSTREPSYLFGTVHLGVSASELPELVWAKLRGSDTVVMEADVRDVDPFEMMKLGMLPEGETLEAMLGPEDWQRLVDALPHVPPGALTRFQPWMVTTLLTMDPEETRMLDMEILQYATEAGKELAFLESAEEQLKMLEGSADLEDLKELLDDVDGARADTAALIEAYRAGDMRAVTEHILDPEEMAEDPETMDRILFDRNRAWIPELEPILAQGNAFVAVGLGHYAGDDGVLALLRRRGYQVDRIGLGTPALAPASDDAAEEVRAAAP